MFAPTEMVKFAYNKIKYLRYLQSLSNVTDSFLFGIVKLDLFS